jgi:YbbR domain-containing protein
MKKNKFKKFIQSAEFAIIIMLILFAIVFFLTYQANKVRKHYSDVERFDQIERHLMEKYPSEIKKL